ncbi:TetR/AcrR family transcriptional regulator [Burkholderia sp. Bp9140]|uniref:TetR/AcrR family transcriptional regulator n=1 Tax=Burkholderia sp. Bp9140 TaxID=2184572 RepID=UPI000F57117D|nr:TetR/AcrR family transcriptional regulator [Burkholderia sp. Bp9140]RQR44348.1 TetR/AcrR family transcriptional regulator [Burkholderia sp. Bp9140]
MTSDNGPVSTTKNTNKKKKAVHDYNEAPRLGDRYAAVLDLQISGDPVKGRSARTNAKLRRSVLDLLSSEGLDALTIARITENAGVAVGTFYLHYENTTDLTLEVFKGYTEHDVRPALPLSPDSGDRTGEMVRDFLEIVASFRHRRKFLGAMFELRRREKRANEIWLNMSKVWAETLSTVADKKGTVSPIFRDLVGHAASCFTDEFLTRIYIDEIFGEEYADDSKNDIEIAEFLALCRHRLLFGSDPTPSLPSQEKR